MTSLSNNDAYRRDVPSARRIDLAAVRRRPKLPARRCCQHCRLNVAEMGPGGSYLDLYLRSGLPTRALAFAAVCWGLGELVGALRLVWIWAIELYARYGGLAGPRGLGGPSL